MDSGIIGDSSGDLKTTGRFPWVENRIVYTRRSRKKVADTNNYNDTAANTTFIPQNHSDLASSAATTSENPTTTTTTPTPADVSSASVQATATTAGYPNDSAAVSHLPTDHDGHTTTTIAIGNRREDVVRDIPGPPVGKDTDSSRLSVGEQSPHHEHIPSRSDSSYHEEQHTASHPEDDSFTLIRLQQDSGGENTKQQSPLPDEVENLKTPSPLDNAKKPPHASLCEQAHNLRGTPVLFGENDQPNGREVARVQLSSGNEGVFAQVPPQVASANRSENNVNGVVKPLVTTRIDDRVIFNFFQETPKNDIEDLRKKLECELHEVRMQVERLEAKKLQLVSYNTPVNNSNHGNGISLVTAQGRNIGGYGNVESQRPLVEDVIDNRALIRMNSEVGVVIHHESRPMALSRVNSDMGAVRNLEPRPYNRQLSVSVMENNHRDLEFVEKEKRTPKANQYYRNSEFLLGKDRLPPGSNKRFKLNNGRKHGVQRERAYGLGFGFSKIRDRVFKSCNGLLQRLMKHKFGWVFNEPVDATALGLADYHDIIKYPMDLGTIKTRLSENRYKSPMEFAQDVRLVFRNAMTYNPKGQDVHVLAEELSQIFEERWAVIETEYNPYLNCQMYQDLPTPTSRKVPPQSHFALAPVHRNAAPLVNVLARAETMTANVAVEPKIQRPHIVRTPVPKKPKARDPNKRDMTYDEKERLSTNLQGMPSEKLDAIVQIIKRRNTALSQHDDEIEVDIDNVDTETLWELDRFVTNYKKSLSKNKRKAELARQARKATSQTVAPTNTPAVTAMQLESAGFEKGNICPDVDGEKQRYDGISSSSSSSDSGSSSDSDSDTSSADGLAHSPKT